MPTDDLDPRVQPSADQIRRRDFATIRRGYDPQQVRAYLVSIANQMGALENEVRRLRREAASAAATGEQTSDPARSLAGPTEDPYDALSKRFATLIEVADQEAEKILTDARSEAGRTLNDAASEADRIRVDAQAHAEQTRQEVADLRERATTESDRVLSGLAERRRSLVTQLEEMRGKLITVAEDLAVSVDEAVRVDADETRLTVVSDDVEIVQETEAPVDSRYEDLWAKKDEPLQVPDLATLERDLEERDT